MRKLFCHTSILLLLLAPASLRPAVPSLAILDFENNSFFKAQEYQSLSKGLAEIMTTELARNPSLRMVERRRLRQLMDELKLAQAGAIPEEGSLRVGKLAGAQHLVFGGYMVAPDDKIRIDVRIVAVETGLTLKAGEATGRTRDVLTLVRRLADKILKDLDVRFEEGGRSAQGKVGLDALTAYSRGVAFSDAGDAEAAAECFRRALELEPGFTLAKERLNPDREP
jgi:TolB-like protein